MDVGIYKVELVVGMIFVEYIFRIIFLIQKGERQGRLAFGIYIDIAAVNAVALHKAYYLFADVVVASFADKSGIHSCASQ